VVFIPVHDTWKVNKITNYNYNYNTTITESFYELRGNWAGSNKWKTYVWPTRTLYCRTQ